MAEAEKYLLLAQAARALELTWFDRPGPWTEEEKALSFALEPLWQEIDARWRESNASRSPAEDAYHDMLAPLLGEDFDE